MRVYFDPKRTVIVEVESVDSPEYAHCNFKMWYRPSEKWYYMAAFLSESLGSKDFKTCISAMVESMGNKMGVGIYKKYFI